jgi:hypothetical protein
MESLVAIIGKLRVEGWATRGAVWKMEWFGFLAS